MPGGRGARLAGGRRREGGFDSRLYEVREIWQKQASPFVASVHYLRTMPSVRRCYGLFESATQELVGVAVLSTPVNPKTLPMVFPELDPSRAAELGRFVLLDRVPANADYARSCGSRNNSAARPGCDWVI